MYSRYPPQSRVPTLVPQGIDRLWYPSQTGIGHMHDELLRDEETYSNSDLDDEDDEEEEEDDDDDDDDDGLDIDGPDDDTININNINNNNDLGMDVQDLDADIEDLDYNDQHETQIYSPTDDLLYNSYEPAMYTHPDQQQQQQRGGLDQLLFAAGLGNGVLEADDEDDPPYGDHYEEGPL
ncbi:hypothetical protein BGZ93_001025 [Podila epicladia]|nr:hypothetical protein BGZ92_009621 [Podila epicladia]KAG0100439.1 hypothetical protein BGZ93_001025 [Podila epicladia]